MGCFVLAIGLAVIPGNCFATVFVASSGNGPNTGTIGAYTNSGAVINASLITGLNGAGSVAASGGFLYVITSDGKIGKYTTSGATVNASLITGLNQPTDIEVSGNQIFVADFANGLFVVGDGFVSKYTTSGEVIQNPLISGLTNPGGIAVEGPSAVPEAFSTWWFGLTAAGLLALARGRKASVS